MRTREEQIRPWGYISPFATKTLKDRARCDLTITRKQTHNITMPLYTEEQLREAERRAEQRVRAEIGRDSERLDWLGSQDVVIGESEGHEWKEVLLARYQRSMPTDLVDIRETIDAAREAG